MDKYRAIPQGYMTVGELAKKMNTTVRTLQYYDKEGLLSPSAESDGGRRLYNDKDMIILHQIQSMKFLGFSLEDIKNRLVNLDTPQQVADVLTAQATVIKEKIESLTEALDAIEILKTETLQMETVNFRKYSDIITLLQKGEDTYWSIKLFSDDMWTHIRKQFDEESSKDYMNRQNALFEKAIKLKNDGIQPDSEQGIEVGKTWLDLIIEFTGGDMSLIPEMQKTAEKRDLFDENWMKGWIAAEEYIQAALGAYIMATGNNPFINMGDELPNEEGIT